MITCFQKLLEFHKICCFQTNEGEKYGPASNSEIRRWFKQGCVEVNFQIVSDSDPWPPFVKSIVLFPKNKRKRCTFFYDGSITLIQIEEMK